MDFNGTGYKTTLRVPDPNGVKRYVFNLTDMAANDKAPTYASVAPIFSERGRSFVGDITSNAIMPFAKIVLNITQLVLDLAGGDEDFVIVLNNSVLELDYDVCNPDSPVEDPWGGCAVANETMLDVAFEISAWEVNLSSVDNDWAGKWAKFQGSGSCLDGDYDLNCTSIGASHANGYITVSESGIVTQFDPCVEGQVAYIYDNDVCE